LLTKYPKCAAALDKYRINPGNVGYGDKHDYNFRSMVKVAIEHNKPIRIGVNWGSLDRELLTDFMNANAKKVRSKSDKKVIIDAMVESALRSAQFAEKEGLQQNKIVLSVKMSEVQDVVKAYELLARRMKDHCYAIHLGLTEAGIGIKGIISSSAALAILLQKGIGDTIRISLTPEPARPRTEEVLACKELIQALGLRHFKAQVTSCPGCGRAENDWYQHLAYQVNKHIDLRMPYWEKHYPKVKTLKIAVMGCIVNGPGEAMHADIGISLPGKSEKPQAQIFEKAKFIKTLSGDNISEQFIQYLEKFIKRYYV
jgi:(E)-4-hydroxy-3-methylbut-2-enyl-diphosphate synthase